jgi:hypothetical protein
LFRAANDELHAHLAGVVFNNQQLAIGEFPIAAERLD